MNHKKDDKKGSSLDSLFGSTSGEDNEQRNDKRNKSGPSIQLPNKNKKESHDTLSLKKRNNDNTESKEGKKVNKKRKLDIEENKETKTAKNGKENGNHLSQYTSKYAFLYEEDAKKQHDNESITIKKGGRYMFLYKYRGKKEDYPNGHNNNHKVIKVCNEQKKKKNCDPNAPKRPQTTFFYFLQEERDKAKKKFTDIKTSKELMKKLGEIWKGMGGEKRQKYNDIYKKEKERYGIERKEYEKTKLPE